MKNLGFIIKGLHFSLYFGFENLEIDVKVVGSLLWAHDSWLKALVVASLLPHSLHSMFFGKMKYSFISSLFGVYPNTIFISIGGILLLQILAFTDMHHKHIFYFCINRDVN
jgi:hypothetical protein